PAAPPRSCESAGGAAHGDGRRAPELRRRLAVDHADPPPAPGGRPRWRRQATVVDAQSGRPPPPAHGRRLRGARPRRSVLHALRRRVPPTQLAPARPRCRPDRVPADAAPRRRPVRVGAVPTRGVKPAVTVVVPT